MLVTSHGPITPSVLNVLFPAFSRTRSSRATAIAAHGGVGCLSVPGLDALVTWTPNMPIAVVPWLDACAEVEVNGIPQRAQGEGDWPVVC